MRNALTGRGLIYRLVYQTYKSITNVLIRKKADRRSGGNRIENVYCIQVELMSQLDITVNRTNSVTVGCLVLFAL